MAHRVFEVTALLATVLLLGWLAVRVARAIETGGQAFWVLTATLGAYLLADLVSGIVHWMGDTLGDENAGWFGAAFSSPFREHHKDPRAIAVHAFVETNGNNGIVALPPLVAAHLWMTATGWRFYMAAFVGALAFFGLATNQCHKWAHTLRPPRVVTVLQRWHLIIAPDHHDRHHEWPHRTHYCVLSGWMNAVADRLKFFRAVEHLIRHTRPGWLARPAGPPS
jgi:ubiquitin-conjugating enzyme E2 variant